MALELSPLPEPRPKPVNRFTAAWDGDCAACSGPIDEGDTAGYVDDEACCAFCCDEEDERNGVET